MLLRVWSRQSLYNNDPDVSNSAVKSLFKVLYYQAFALVYGFAGACAGNHAGCVCVIGGVMTGVIAGQLLAFSEPQSELDTGIAAPRGCLGGGCLSIF